ncbi:enoyl-CoA hydratase/isomerase family protein [Terrilactibacillus sp. S3-3]|nr:enoyl-CoA hydratase/isomerase family protein [Terrilactibacillus sp. S3-3]
MKHLTVKDNEGMAEVILQRAPVNALNEEMVAELYEVLRHIEAEKDIRAVIIRSGLSCFVAGADIKMMEDLQRNQETGRMLGYLKKLQETLNILENLSKPTIAYINGHAMGGGLELALACDFRMMVSEKARIGLPEIKLGMTPGAGGTHRLTRIIGETKTKELIYFGRSLTAEEAYQIGIISKVVHPDQGLAVVFEMAHQLAEQAPIALSGIKRCIQATGQSALAAGLEMDMVETAKVFTSEDAKIGFQAFLEKRSPVFKGV